MKLFYSLFLSLLFTSAGLFGQSAEWTQFKSPEMVNDYIEQGPYLWLATNHGVTRLNKDDLSTTVWTADNSALSSSHIVSVTMDSEMGIWIGTYDLDIALWNGNEWEVTSLPKSLSGDLTTDNLYAMEFDLEGNLWIGNQNGLHRRVGDVWTTWNQFDTSAPISHTWNITFDESNTPYFLSFFIYKMENDLPINLSGSSGELISYGDAFLEHIDGVLWFSTPTQTFAKYENEEWTIYPTTSEESWSPPYTGAITNVTQTADGAIWANTSFQGIYKLDDDLWVQQNDLLSESMNLQMDWYYQDEEQRSWGMDQTQISSFDGEEITKGDIGVLSIRHNNVRSIHETPEGGLMVLSDYHFLDLYQDGSWSPFFSPMDTATNWNIISDMDYDQEGNLWLANTLGLLKYDGQEWESITKYNSDFPLNLVSGVECGPNGIIAATIGMELAIYDGQNWVHYTEANAPLIGDTYFRDVAIDQNGVVWVSQSSNYIYRIENEEWTVYSSANTILPNDDFWISDIHIDMDNVVWISLGSYGIMKVEGDEWTHIFNDTPLEEGYSSYIEIGPFGHLYNSGAFLSILDPEGNWTVFDETNAPLNGNFQHLEADSQGNLWISSAQEGMVRYANQQVVNTSATTIFDEPFTASPNPGGNHLHIQLATMPNTPLTLDVFDLQGKLLHSYQLTAGQQQHALPAHFLPKGAYALRLKMEQAIQTTLWQKITN
jgi:ligand-binding sensor domain-containing protein